MALGRDRTPQSLQGFDPDFFVGGGCSDGNLGSLLDADDDLQDPQSILGFKAAAAADHWAYPSTNSSVLTFGQGDSRPWIGTAGSRGPADTRQGEDHFRLLYPGVPGAADRLEEGGQTEGGHKRQYPNRRERISERLKVLQELVPNGTKVDLVTMLEKAISYVKFLQLQVKVLATDEFWPAQGGKAPEAAQVKEAIDAILSSHRGKN